MILITKEYNKYMCGQWHNHLYTPPTTVEHGRAREADAKLVSRAMAHPVLSEVQMQLQAIIGCRHPLSIVSSAPKEWKHFASQ